MVDNWSIISTTLATLPGPIGQGLHCLEAQAWWCKEGQIFQLRRPENGWLGNLSVAPRMRNGWMPIMASNYDILSSYQRWLQPLLMSGIGPGTIGLALDSLEAKAW